MAQEEDSGEGFSSAKASEELSSDIEAEYDIVEHEQAHAVVMAKSSRFMSPLEEDEEGRLNQSHTDLRGEGELCESFLDNFAGMINRENLQAILKEQQHMLSTMEVANEKLASLNSISERNFQAMSADFRQSTHMLVAMKKQLDSCFRRIRLLKAKLSVQYPEAYKAAVAQCQVEELDDDG